MKLMVKEMVAMRILPTILVLTAVGSAPVFAAAPPPDGSKSLSEIVQQIEQKPDFHYIDEIDLDDGLYEVEYYTQDGAEHEIYIDPRTGQER